MNPEVMMDLDTAVNEVATELFGLDLSYVPEYDTYRVITKALNRALRAMALEKEWSYYSTVTSLGPAVAGERVLRFRNTERPRIINDDAVRLVDTDGRPVVWAYFLPRDALHKYYNKVGLWCSVTGQDLTFSRPFSDVEDGLDVQLPVMREPLMFRLPPRLRSSTTPAPTCRTQCRLQPVDFPYPDVVSHACVASTTRRPTRCCSLVCPRSRRSTRTSCTRSSNATTATPRRRR
jgi:hypothetical protein